MNIFKEGKYFGLKDDTGSTVLQARYHAIFRVNKNLWGFRHGIRWGMVKKSGELVISAVLNAYIERELLHESVEESIYKGASPFFKCENPFVERFAGDVVKYYDTIFIEEEQDNFKHQEYFMSLDNIGKSIIINAVGDIVFHDFTKGLIEVDHKRIFLIFIDEFVNIFDIKVKKYLLERWVSSHEFYQDPFGAMFLVYKNKKYELTAMNFEIEKLC